MFKKVLIVDDIDVVNIGVQSALTGLEIEIIIHSTYCDDAYLKIKRASLDNVPFDLIICDLSFVENHRTRDITSGQALIEKIKVTYPALNIIVFSVEEHPQTIKELWRNFSVDAYVCKDREGIRELLKAIEIVFSGERYLPVRLRMLIKLQNTIVLSGYDERLLLLLSQGYNQNEIEALFKKDGVIPASRSSLEKRLKDLREEFEAQTNVHLISIVKDYKLI